MSTADILDLLKKSKYESDLPQMEKDSAQEKGQVKDVVQQIVPVGYRPPLFFFPEEIWLMIFDKVNPLDLYASVLGNQSFSFLWERRKQVELFPAILPFLKLNDGSTKGKKALYNCRLVCHKWKESIESYVAGPVNPQGRTLVYSFESADEISNFLELMSQRPIVEANPFFSRSVRFFFRQFNINAGLDEEENDGNAVGVGGDEVNDDPNDYLRMADLLLVIYGKHIHECHISVDRYLYQTAPEQLYKLLSRLLGRMQNLKSFTLAPTQPIQLYYNEVHTLKPLIAARPLSLLPCMTQVCLQGMPPESLAAVLNSCDREKIEKLRILSVLARGEEVARFVNLTYIGLTIYQRSVLRKFLTGVSWPLVTADLAFQLKEARRNGITFAKVFQFLNQFGGTLRSVKLNLSGGARYGNTPDGIPFNGDPYDADVSDEDGSVGSFLEADRFDADISDLEELSDEDAYDGDVSGNEVSDDEAFCKCADRKDDPVGDPSGVPHKPRSARRNDGVIHRLNLPILRTLKMELGHFVKIYSLEFVRNLTQLVNFRLRTDAFRGCRNPKEEILFVGYERKMLESNLWQILPRLRCLSLQERTGNYQYRWKGSRQTSTSHIQEL